MGENLILEKTSPNKLELTNEQLEKFNRIYKYLGVDTFDSMSNQNHDFERFEKEWNSHSYDIERLTALLSNRRKWVEIMSLGPKFQEFIEGEITKNLEDKTRIASYNRYKLITDYFSLGYDTPNSFIITLLNNETVWNNPDGSTMHKLLNYIERKRSPEITDAVKQYIERIIEDDYTRHQYLTGDLANALNTLGIIANIGTARDTLANILSKKPSLTAYFAGHGDIFDGILGLYYKEVKPNEFDPTKENERLKSLEEELARLKKHPVDRPKDLDDDEGYDDYYGTSSLGGISLTDDPWNEGSHLRDERMETLDKETDEMIGRVNNLTLNEGLAPTAVSAIQLNVFNFLRQSSGATDEEVMIRIEKLRRLSDKEKLSSNIKNPLPTMGIEIEIPMNVLDGKKVAILNKFFISNYREILDDLWEVNPDFSYCAETQARIIQELAKMGALPIDRATKKIDDYSLLSLHVNFGIPSGITGEDLDKYQIKMELMNDVLIYAYSSINRIKGRKTNTSLTWNHAASSSEKNSNGIDQIRVRSQAVRLELRANEFKDYPTYRMLSESQEIVAMFCSYLKVKEGLQYTFVDAYLSDLWDKFEIEVSNYLKSEGLSPNSVDMNRDLVIEKMQNTDIQKWSRFLVFDYAKKVREVIKDIVPVI
ncbi:MAG: hypothetical protein WC631_01265 [Candidatus Paceibacterota bacterium]|jgi:hypothetical protein